MLLSAPKSLLSALKFSSNTNVACQWLRQQPASFLFASGIHDLVYMWHRCLAKYGMMFKKVCLLNLFCVKEYWCKKYQSNRLSLQWHHHHDATCTLNSQLILKNKLPTKPIFCILRILKINRMMHGCRNGSGRPGSCRTNNLANENFYVHIISIFVNTNRFSRKLVKLLPPDVRF